MKSLASLRALLARRASAPLAALALCAAACRPTPPSPAERPPRSNVTLSRESRPYVTVERAARPTSALQHSLFARVSFDERKVAALGSPVSGRVMAVNVVTGSAVQQGQPLVVIRSTDVTAARAQLIEARQTRMLATQAAARARMLVTQGAGSLAEQQQADTALVVAVAEERRASQALGALGATDASEDFVLRAPRAGVVVERSVQPGNAISADSGQPLLTIADLSTVWVIADVFEQDVSAVRVGDRAEVTVGALDSRRYDGRIDYVGDVVDATTRAARARIQIDNGDGALRPGMFAAVVVSSSTSAPAMVPVSAVLARRDEFVVYVPAGDSSFAARRVRIGAQTGDHVIVLEGLRPGDDVVTRGAILLDAEANSAL